MLDRINLVIRTQNMSSSQFADEIGVQRSSISHILSGRNNPSLEFVTKVLNRFPELETDWLLFGKGTMYKNIVDSKPELVSQKQNSLFFEPDLFSVAIEEPQKEEIKIAKNEIVTKEDVLEDTKNQSIEKEEQPHEISINAVVEDKTAKYAILNKEKKIEKFVILYNDKTFSEYFPE